MRKGTVSLKEWCIDNDRLDILSSFDEKKNGFSAAEIGRAMSKKVWWTCPKSAKHSYLCSTANRTKGRDCPYCAGKKILVGDNDLFSTNPELKADWFYEKNQAEDLYPEKCTSGTHKSAWWKCSNCGYEWKAIIFNRSRGHGCPSCSHSPETVHKSRDIATSAPWLLEEWDYERNTLNPSEVLISSDRKISWICSKCGYRWTATPANRFHAKSGCPRCAGSVVDAGVTDLATVNPGVAKMWDYEKNTLRPDQVTSKTHQRAYFICPKGHSFKASIANISRGEGCPICGRERKVSMPEHALFYYLNKIFPDIKQACRLECMENKELDIFIPSIRLAVEYDGSWFHSNIERDIKKYELCKKNGIRLINIREEKCPELPGYMETIIRINNTNESLNDVIRTLIKQIGLEYVINSDIVVDVDKDQSEILSMYITHEKDNSLATQFPEIAAEWDYEKNDGINPKMFTPGSNRRVFWKCSKCGHRWKTGINSRTGGTGCPACSRKTGSAKKASDGPDRLLKNNALIEEYDFTKNNYDLDTLRIGSHKIAWWKCSNCGCEWQADIHVRARGGHKCPNCKAKHDVNTIK